MKYDNINPSHYKDGDKEVWQMMIDIYGLKAYLNFCMLNAFKYRMRAGKKEGAEYTDDIKKAIWYETQVKKLKNGSNDIQERLREGHSSPYYSSVSSYSDPRWQFSNDD